MAYLAGSWDFSPEAIFVIQAMHTQELLGSLSGPETHSDIDSTIHQSLPLSFRAWLGCGYPLACRPNQRHRTALCSLPHCLALQKALSYASIG